MTRATAIGFAMLFALAVTFAASLISSHMAGMDATWAQDAALHYDLEVQK